MVRNDHGCALLVLRASKLCSAATALRGACAEHQRRKQADSRDICTSQILVLFANAYVDPHIRLVGPDAPHDAVRLGCARLGRKRCASIALRAQIAPEATVHVSHSRRACRRGTGLKRPEQQTMEIDASEWGVACSRVSMDETFNYKIEASS